MSDNPIDTPRRGWRRTFNRWLSGPAPVPDLTRTTAGTESAAAPDSQPARISHYTIARKLGEGGMGVVYAARDERLQRTVALKTISSAVADGEIARKRFWREARAAASVNHPNICLIHDIGEAGGTLFIAMELLEGESLADRLKRGPMPVADAVAVALEILAALSALHRSGVIHRDVKPSNVFLTPHGVKLLDFGLARHEGPAQEAALALTRTGIAIGTPRYMAPEQLLDEAVDGRADLFAAGAVLFEMLAGRPAFIGRTIVDVLHATLHEQPPALSGSPAVAAVDRVIRRALAKRPDQRFSSADEIATELRELPAGRDETRTIARALTRVVVLPFRVLRPDPDIDFLAFSLADAIATSLSGVKSLVVRSSAIAARFAGDAPDLRALASDADVDRVVMGTLLRSGDQVRATAQLVEAPGGTLLTSHTVDSTLGDLFALQDDITRRVVGAMASPLGGETASPSPDVAPNPRAYEFYLRGNELARSYQTLPEARELYLRALEIDPQFAVAWAQLGRCHRVIGKYVESTAQSEQWAEEAFQRALELNPRLSVAHKFYAALESDIGQAGRAIVRLLREAARTGNDPELFAGLTHACRYAGLYDESIAAHVEAHRLDPNVTTSLLQTLLMAGRFERLTEAGLTVSGGADEGIRVIGLGLWGRHDEARNLLARAREAMPLLSLRIWADHLHAWLDRRTGDMVQLMEAIGVKVQVDPEAMFLEGWLLCEAGAPEEGLRYLQRGVANGYLAAPVLASSRHFDPLRTDPRFQAICEEAEAGTRFARAAFSEAGGERLLGRQPARVA